MIKAETKENEIRIDFKGTAEDLMQEMGGLAEKFIVKILQKDADEFMDEFAKDWIEFRKEQQEAKKDEAHMC